jgi:hypothetical protein
VPAISVAFFKGIFVVITYRANQTNKAGHNMPLINLPTLNVYGCWYLQKIAEGRGKNFIALVSGK